MAERKLTSTIRSASAVNLKYSAELLNLAREYVQAFVGAVTSAEPEPEGGTASRPPLLLAGRTGETANAAFALNNTGKLKGTVTLQVTGAFEDSVVKVEPERLSFDEEDDKIVRILATIGKAMPADTDFVGSVIIPELDHRITRFVLRKLGD